MCRLDASRTKSKKKNVVKLKLNILNAIIKKQKYIMIRKKNF